MSQVSANGLASSELGERELLRRRYAKHFQPFYQDNLMAIFIGLFEIFVPAHKQIIDK